MTADGASMTADDCEHFAGAHATSISDGSAPPAK